MMLELIAVAAFAVAMCGCWYVDWRGRQRWKTPEIELLRAKLHYDEQIRKGK